MRKGKTCQAALTVLLATWLVGCGPKAAELPTTFGDGSFHADFEIQTGTYETPNPGPHTKTVKCSWSVSKTSSGGKVLLRSEDDTAEKPQRVYLRVDDRITSHFCGTWHKISDDNIT